jgi:regulator of protease activity HflC (stomatin/prohibitin superfamily)
MEVKVMSVERAAKTANGWAMLVVDIVLYAAATALIVFSFLERDKNANDTIVPIWWMLITGCVVLAAAIVVSPGFFTLQPNEARVLILFGDYKGTSRETGFRWGNPFFANGSASSASGALAKSAEQMAAAAKKDKSQNKPRTLGRYKVSLRARTLNGDRLKVNDKRGNPVEIAAVVVWRVEDTAQAVFDVDDYEQYVSMQSETALRHVATAYAYDHSEDEEGDEITLRSNVTDVSQALKVELEERLAKAGVVVNEARLTHLAYAPEIAQAMLRRQQAEAIIAARRKIVVGAVSMVEMALQQLSEKNVVELDEERKAAMTSNLLVVLCGESEVHPVVNTGTLYQ